jgi:hypothetical protein
MESVRAVWTFAHAVYPNQVHHGGISQPSKRISPPKHIAVMSFPVKLHVYDLSQGMARQMSQAFLGKYIEGIWHTGIVVYDTEFFFGGGICSGAPV